MKRIFGFVSAVAGLGAVSWLLKDRLVPVPDTSRREEPPPFKRNDPAPGSDTEGSPGAADDLTEINGIGPAFARKLAGRGIVTFASLAEADAAELADAITGASLDQVEDWQGQARSRA